MTGITPAAGGGTTIEDPAPNEGGAITPRSGTGRAPPPSASGFSLRGRSTLADPSAAEGGRTGATLRGRTTSGTLCAHPGEAATNAAPSAAHAHHAGHRSACTTAARARPR